MITIKESKVSKFGLIGKNIDYSFSRSFFNEKFERENLKHSYKNFDIENVNEIGNILLENKNLKGLNVTIPYKETIIPFLDGLDKTAETIGAVNVIKILNNGQLIGYNSDFYGFEFALSEFLPLKKKSALILGTGGASKAIAYALDRLGFTYNYVSRKKNKEYFQYSDLNQKVIENSLLIINCTPLGTAPDITACPPIPYQFLTKDHLLFDLIYNPAETQFLKFGKNIGAKTSNGRQMLELQAKKAWEIWNL